MSKEDKTIFLNIPDYYSELGINVYYEHCKDNKDQVLLGILFKNGNLYHSTHLFVDKSCALYCLLTKNHSCFDVLLLVEACKKLKFNRYILTSDEFNRFTSIYNLYISYLHNVCGIPEICDIDINLCHLFVEQYNRVVSFVLEYKSGLGGQAEVKENEN